MTSGPPLTVEYTLGSTSLTKWRPGDISPALAAHPMVGEVDIRDTAHQLFYHAECGPITLNNMPPDNVHLEDIHVYDIFRLYLAKAIGRDALAQHYPAVFAKKGVPLSTRPPMGRPVIIPDPHNVAGSGESWGYASIFGIYHLTGGAYHNKNYGHTKEAAVSGVVITNAARIPWYHKNADNNHTVTGALTKWEAAAKDGTQDQLQCQPIMVAPNVAVDWDLIDLPPVADLSRVNSDLLQYIKEKWQEDDSSDIRKYGLDLLSAEVDPSVKPTPSGAWRPPNISIDVTTSERYDMDPVITYSWPGSVSECKAAVADAHSLLVTHAQDFNARDADTAQFCTNIWRATYQRQERLEIAARVWSRQYRDLARYYDQAAEQQLVSAAEMGKTTNDDIQNIKDFAEEAGVAHLLTPPSPLDEEAIAAEMEIIHGQTDIVE